MIASLRGNVLSIGLSSAVIECAGVGYTFAAAPSTLAQLKRGEEALVLTTMVVREDAMLLYGFTDDESREMFSLVQSVSGLGPKLALAIQSVFTPTELANAIAGEDSKALQRVPGVGKRMADRMVVELKDKVKAFVAVTPETSKSASGVTPTSSVLTADVVEALVGLGFNEKTAQTAVEAVLEVEPDLDTPHALRAALKHLGKG